MIELPTGKPQPEGDSPQPQAATVDQETTLSELTTSQLADLGDAAKQTEYQRQYLLQLERRRGCPGCGD